MKIYPLKLLNHLLNQVFALRQKASYIRTSPDRLASKVPIHVPGSCQVILTKFIGVTLPVIFKLSAIKKGIILLTLVGNIQVTTYSQVISGYIKDSSNHSPIDYATVYFNGTFVGTRSDQNGYFKLDISKYRSMPLTISALGYFSMTVSDLSTDLALLVYLSPKTFDLKEVIITADSKETETARIVKKARISLFKQEFLGNTQNALRCNITNEDDIMFKYDPDNKTLKAFASKPIIIDNKGLGYKITFYLDKFEFSEKMKSILIIGNIIFKEDSSITMMQRKMFERRRKSAYLGSKMHFFRTLWEDKLNSSGFTIKNKLNQSLKYFQFVTAKDSLTKYLYFPDSPLIVYYDTKTAGSFLLKINDYVLFDKNGYYDGNGLSFDGEMAKSRLADLLPYEYIIDKTNY